MSSLASLELQELTRQVRAILNDPHAPAHSTGTSTLDGALAALAQLCSSEQPLTVDILPFWFVPPPGTADADASENGDQVLDTAFLPRDVATACQDALSRHGRLFSATPAWSRLFLAWIAAADEARRALFLPAAVACECMAAGYDLLDAAAPGEPDSSSRTASDTLLDLSQSLLLEMDVPTDCRLRAGTALRRAGRRALAAQRQDIALRKVPTASPDVVLGILRQRSGMLVAATCQCATLLTGAHWRTVGVAGRFGVALGAAAQLEDDLADLGEDAVSRRKTLPVLLTQMHPDEPEIVRTLTWVLIQQYLQEAADVLAYLHRENLRTEVLWSLLPGTPRAA